MKRLLGALLVAILAYSPVRADDAGASAILDKAIKALGGDAKLAKANAITWKAKGKLIFNDNENEFTSQATARGLDRFRSEFSGEFNGNAVKGITVLNGDKAWRHFGGDVMELDDAGVKNEKRQVYLQVAPVLVIPLKANGFKVETAAEEKVNEKPAAVLKITAPDGKDFTLAFDKESGLPVKQVATVVGFNGDEFTQETIFTDYKDFDGIKKATKIVWRRDGQRFVEVQVTEFKVLDSVEDATFAEPK